MSPVGCVYIVKQVEVRWRALLLCSVDIFFLDWEKPRRVLAKGGGREEPGPISAWRRLLVANEWNELQTARMTYPSFTLICMVNQASGHRTRTSRHYASSVEQTRVSGEDVLHCGSTINGRCPALRQHYQRKMSCTAAAPSTHQPCSCTAGCIDSGPFVQPSWVCMVA